MLFREIVLHIFPLANVKCLASAYRTSMPLSGSELFVWYFISPSISIHIRFPIFVLSPIRNVINFHLSVRMKNIPTCKIAKDSWRICSLQLKFYYFLIISWDNEQLMMYDAHMMWVPQFDGENETNDGDDDKWKLWKYSRATHITKLSWFSSMMSCEKTCGFIRYMCYSVTVCIVSNVYLTSVLSLFISLTSVFSFFSPFMNQLVIANVILWNNSFNNRFVFISQFLLCRLK